MYETKSIYKDGNRIAYGIIHGGNKPFIMLPGISLSSILNNIAAIEVAYKEVLEKYTIYVFDHAMPTSDNYTMDDAVTNIVYVLDEIGITNAVVYGVSIGALIALKMPLIRSDLIEKMIIVAGTAKTDDKQLETLRHWEKMSNNFEIENLNKDFFIVMFTSDYVNKNLDALDSFVHNGTKEDCIYFSRTIRTMYDFDILDDIKNIKIPTMVFGSKLDPIFGVNASKKIAEALNCEIYIYDNYSHAFYDEAPDFKHRFMCWLKSDNNLL